MINDTGWCDWAEKILSPNYDERPSDCSIDLVVIHGISLPAGEFGTEEIKKLFLNNSKIEELKDLKVSAHFVIDRMGKLQQFVSCTDRAWHAGQSTWNNKNNCNDFSIGIELEGTDDINYTDIQYEKLIKLLKELVAKYPKIKKFTGHCHIASKRKTDPGEVFDWNKLFSKFGNEFDGRK